MYQPLSIVDMKCLSLDYETMVSFRTKENIAECSILKYNYMSDTIIIRLLLASDIYSTH